jgi:hypothetical protein
MERSFFANSAFVLPLPVAVVVGLSAVAVSFNIVALEVQLAIVNVAAKSAASNVCFSFMV